MNLMGLVKLKLIKKSYARRVENLKPETSLMHNDETLVESINNEPISDFSLDFTSSSSSSQLSSEWIEEDNPLPSVRNSVELLDPSINPIMFTGPSPSMTSMPFNMSSNITTTELDGSIL